MTNSPDILIEYRDKLKFEEIMAARKRYGQKYLSNPHWNAARALFEKLPVVESLEIDLDTDSISIQSQHPLTLAQEQIIEEATTSVIPWRKGPFSLFHQDIDSEWRSQRKWHRISPHLDQVKGKRVIDIGGNNGYFAFRLIPQHPSLILNIDPSARCYYQFELLQRYIQEPRVQYELFGVDDCHMFPRFFHIALFMGIIYHCRSPLDSLQQVLECLTPGGQIIFESMAVPGEQPTALCVPDRYAKMRNAWFVPTSSWMCAWAKTAGFTDVELVSVERLTPEEQRRTELSPYESLKDYLNPDNHEFTIEGHPAPLRAVVVGRKP